MENIKSGVLPVRRDKRDYDLLKTRKLGLAKMPTLPANYDTDAHLTMPDQRADGRPNGCTGYTTTELCNDEDGIVYDDIDFTLSKTEGYDPMLGAGIKESLSTSIEFGVKTLQEKEEDAIKHKREAYFRITAQYPLDWFDAIRVAMWITQDERRTVSMATPWYPEWMNPQNGVVTTPYSELSKASWHNWKVSGWKTINGKLYLTSKPWLGKYYGDNGLAYFSREIVNNIMVISGTGAFTLDKIMPDEIKTVDLTVIESLVNFMQNLLKYLASLIQAPTMPEIPKIQPLPSELPPELPKVPPPPPEPQPEPISPAEHFYNICKESLGEVLVEKDKAELGCVIAISILRKRAFGNAEPQSEGTWTLMRELEGNGNYKEVFVPEKGAIILCATGTGNGKLPHGHVGVCGIYGIMSNDSETGRWEQNYSYEGWKNRYEVVGGFPTRYFLRIKN